MIKPPKLIPWICHRPVAWWCVAVTLGLGTPHARAAEAAQSQWVYPGPDGKLVYKATPAGDRVMDFSYAGYMGGGVALPKVAVKRTVQPSGRDDDTAAIQAALNEVGAMPPENGFRGAVLLGPGTFSCSMPLLLTNSGVVLRGSGSTGDQATTLRITGRPHTAIIIGGRSSNRAARATEPEAVAAQTSFADSYVPSGARSFHVADAKGFAVGDTILIRRPVTERWVREMQMHNLTRDGRPQTWLRAGSSTVTERRIAAISGNTFTLEVPLSDSFDAKYLTPPGVSVIKISLPARVSQVGVESLHLQCPPQHINHSEPHFSAVRLSGEDCWLCDLVSEETMNSIGVSGQRLTLQRVTINRNTAHVGASKPAEFAPNAGQVLLDRCSAAGENVWYAATGAGQAGPIVLLNCAFRGHGRVEGHQRWTTGVLYDNCHVPDGGMDFRNRGAMGSGHGWSIGWGVAWNCVADNFVIQNPPGAANWMIGCIGRRQPMPRPFDKEPNLPEGIVDSPNQPVRPQSLYLTQLTERLGPEAAKNLGY